MKSFSYLKARWNRLPNFGKLLCWLVSYKCLLMLGHRGMLGDWSWTSEVGNWLFPPHPSDIRIVATAGSFFIITTIFALVAYNQNQRTNQ